jgi:hypothetical protein
LSLVVVLDLWTCTDCRSFFAQVGKAGGEKWKDMSDAVSLIFTFDCFGLLGCTSVFLYNFTVLCLQEKAPYINKATQKKTEYVKTLAAYKQKQV